MKKFHLIILINIILLSSCGQIDKKLASDEIIGMYTGKVTYIYKHTLQNIGLEDESKETEGSISIFKNKGGDIYIQTGDGNIKISALTKISNGTTFNIPNQNIKQPDGTIGVFQGFQNADVEGVKYDGILLTQSNVLTFGYETLIKYNYSGQLADLSVLCVFEFKKI